MQVTQRELAKISGLSLRAIYQLEHDRVIWRTATRKYEVEAIIRKIISHYKGRALSAEHVCRTFCPEELEAYREGYRISDDDDVWT